jgi:hypothetical protein
MKAPTRRRLEPEEKGGSQLKVPSAASDTSRNGCVVRGESARMGERIAPVNIHSA